MVADVGALVVLFGCLTIGAQALKEDALAHHRDGRINAFQNSGPIALGLLTLICFAALVAQIARTF
jgi:hypothetical protein